jgi:hypothetical protein
MAGCSRFAGRFHLRNSGWRAGVVLIAGVAACLAVGRGGAARAGDKNETTGKSGKAAVEKRAAEAVKEGDEAPANPPESDKSKARMAEMRKLAAGLQVMVGDANPVEAELIPEALFRCQDPARELSPDGAVWGYGKKGRPAALLSLTLKPARPDRRGGWMMELDSLASGPVQAAVLPGLTWATRKPGIEFKEFPGAPPAAEKEAGRGRQFRELSARFTGYESLLAKGPDAPAERYELRLIPRPIHRYSDPDRGQIDGAIFLMTYSTNPEVILVIELVKEGQKNVWKYAFNRIAYAELHVDLDGKEVWRQPHLQGTSINDVYGMFYKAGTEEGE